ncbi:MAG TPA: DUF3999 family protein [Silvibacterium sp.]|nr:DUF3999 family protein [Silvibacterium sp.]
MKLGILVLLLAAVATSPVLPDARYFRYERPLLNTPPQELQTCVALDPAVFEHSAPMLSDLRLYRDGKEVPYAIRFAAPGAAAPAKIAPLNLGTQNGRVVFDAEMPDGSYSDVDLDLREKDFIATVDVTGSHSPDGEKTKLGTFTVFDFTGQKLGRSMVLHLPQSDFRQLHFRIEGPIKPEDVSGLTVERVSEGEPRSLTVAENAQARQKDGETVVEFTVPGNVPVDRVEFVAEASPANFSRNVTMTVTRAGKNPPDSGRSETFTYSGSILRFHGVRDGHRIDEERLKVDVPPSTLAEIAGWTVKIDNGDDPPIALKSVRLEMLERTLCFNSIPGGKYLLYYGDPALAAPRYDYATLFSQESGAARAALGPEQENPEYRPRPDARPFTERHPALLWVALVLVIVLLGGIALRSAKQVNPR